jgi:hypothetical protein
MARSGCLSGDLLAGGGLELVGSLVAQGAVQPGAVVPGDVVHGGPACRGPGGPRLQVQALALERRTIRPARYPSTARSGRSTTGPRDRWRARHSHRWCTGSRGRRGRSPRPRDHALRRQLPRTQMDLTRTGHHPCWSSSQRPGGEGGPRGHTPEDAPAYPDLPTPNWRLGSGSTASHGLNAMLWQRFAECYTASQPARWHQSERPFYGPRNISIRHGLIRSSTR